MSWQSDVLKKPSLDIKTDGGYTYKQVMESRNTSKHHKYWYLIADTDRYLFRSSVAESWEFTLPNGKNPIKNMKQVYLRFLNTKVFTEAASKYNTFGYYTSHPQDTFEYERFWDEEEERCEKGLEVDGVRITGRHYFMINYTMMTAMPEGKQGAKIKRIPGFVDFQFYLIHELAWWSLDYPYNNRDAFLTWFSGCTNDDFEDLVLQIGVLPKARRKGLTYVAGNALVSYDYVWVQDSFTIVGTYTTDMYEVMQTEAVEESLNHIDQNTPWVRRSAILDRKEWFESSFYEEETKEDGSKVKIKKGYRSSVMYLGFYNNSFKGVGKSVSRMVIEEAGKFNNLEATYPISIEPLIRDGEVKTGSGLILGAAGEMSANGGSVGLSRMAYNPEVYRLASYENIYDKSAVGKSCLFIDDLWYSPSKSKTDDLLLFCKDESERNYLKSFGTKYVSGVDDQGNSLRLIAELVWERKAAPIRVDEIQFNLFLTQQPRHLSDAFFVPEAAVFDANTVRQVRLLLKQQRESGELIERYGMFVEDGKGGITFRHDNSLRPILTYDRSSDRVPGCWVIWEEPVRLEGKVQYGRYLIGTDPIAKGYEESSAEGLHSLASTFVMDSFTGNIVAEYTGRPARVDIYNRELLKGVQYYNTQTMYENNIPGLGEYCKLMNKSHLLANEPMLIKQRVSVRGASTVIKGYTAKGTDPSWLREAVATWLSEEVLIAYDDGTPVYGSRYFTIKSTALLDELEMWNPKGNFDRISALQALVLFYLDSKPKIARAKNETVAKKGISDLERLLKNSYRNNGIIRKN